MRGKIARRLHWAFRASPRDPWLNSVIAVACAAFLGTLLVEYLRWSRFNATTFAGIPDFIVTAAEAVLLIVPITFLIGLWLFFLYVLPVLAVLLAVRLAGPAIALAYPVLCCLLLLQGPDRLLAYPVVASLCFVALAYRRTGRHRTY